MNNALKLVTIEETENKMTELTQAVEQVKTEVSFPAFEKKVIYDANGNPIEGFSASLTVKLKK